MNSSSIDMMGRMLDTRPVSMEEQVPLILAAKQGDEKAFLRLFGAVFQYIVREAKRWASRRSELEPEDLITAGMEGVRRAIKKFDVEKPIKFLTYAGWWIRHFIRRNGQSAGLVKQPAYRYGADHIEEAKMVDQMVYLDAISMEGEESSGSVMEVMATKFGLVDDSMMDQAETHVMASRVLSISARLPIRERFAFEATVTGDMTLQDAGRYLDLTRERIRQLRLSGIAKMRYALEHGVEVPMIWVPPSLNTCLTPSCGRPNTTVDGGGALRCQACFMDFAGEARWGA